MKKGKKNVDINKRNDIVTKIIHDREYDIPEWVYDYVNPEVIMGLLKNESLDFIFKKYIANPIVRKFYDTVRKRIRWSRHQLVELDVFLFNSAKLPMMILLLNKKEWKYVINLKKGSIWSNLNIVELFKKYLLMNDIFNDIARDIYKVSNIDKKYLIKMIYVSIKNKENKCEYIDRLMKILKVSKSYELCEFCYYSDIPVLYENGDYVDLYNYLYKFITTEWVGDIDENIINIGGANTPEIISMLGFIGERLDNKAIKILKVIHGDVFIQPTNVIREITFDSG